MLGDLPERTSLDDRHLFLFGRVGKPVGPDQAGMKAQRDGNGVGLAIIEPPPKPAINVLPVHIETSGNPRNHPVQTCSVALAQGRAPLSGGF
jgi:hypothetical protein